MLTNRQKLILKAIVEEYVNTANPVASFDLMAKPYLNFSSATLRAEMATLEQLGLIEKPHTSSGRVPTSMGYKYYVDNLVTRDSEVVSNFPLIDQIFQQHDLMKEEAIKEAMNLLSKLTNYTSMALGADYRNELVKKMDFIPVSDKEAVILIVTNLGHVSNQMIKIPNGLNPDELKKVVKVLDEVLKNKPLNDVEKILNDEFARLQVKDLMEYHDQLLNTFVNAFSKFYKDNYYLSGMSNVFGQPEFNDVNKLKKFMEAFEEGEVMKLVGNTNGLTVRIGSENKILAMDDCTIISVPYRIDDEKIGTIAVIGPTRMEYKKVIPLVEYIAGNMTKLYKK